MYPTPETYDIAEPHGFGEIVSGNVVHEYPQKKFQSTIRYNIAFPTFDSAYHADEDPAGR